MSTRSIRLLLLAGLAVLVGNVTGQARDTVFGIKESFDLLRFDSEGIADSGLERFGTVIRVPLDYSTIQQAIDAAQGEGGEVILVFPGTYFERIDFKGKNVHLLSARGPETTIIDGGAAGSVVLFQNGETEDAVLQGFTIMNGLSQYGGIHCHLSSPTIVDNIVRDNRALEWGGGIYCFKAPALIARNRVLENRAEENGGGICCKGTISDMNWEKPPPRIFYNLISGNWAGVHGGGVYCKYIDPWICGNRISLNRTGNVGAGGGVYLNRTIALVSGNWIVQNQATYQGGGIRVKRASPIISGNHIMANRAEREGGGLSSFDSPGVLIHTNVFQGNSSVLEGGGLHFDRTTARILNNTVHGNWTEGLGGGVSSFLSSLEIAGSIFWMNEAPTGPAIYGTGCQVVYSDVEFGFAGEGNLDLDPLLLDPDGLDDDLSTWWDNDLHLSPQSPCIDAGMPQAPSFLLHDIEGDPRVLDGDGDGIPRLDLGVDEFAP